jgi:hypothetical protein
MQQGARQLPRYLPFMPSSPQGHVIGSAMRSLSTSGVTAAPARAGSARLDMVQKEIASGSVHPTFMSAATPVYELVSTRLHATRGFGALIGHQKSVQVANVLNE